MMTKEQIERLLEFIEAPKFQSGWERITEADFEKFDMILSDHLKNMDKMKTVGIELSYDDVVFLWACIHNCHNMQLASVGIMQGVDKEP